MFTSEGVPHLSLRGWWGWGRLGGDFWVVLVASVGWILGEFFWIFMNGWAWAGAPDEQLSIVFFECPTLCIQGNALWSCVGCRPDPVYKARYIKRNTTQLWQTEVFLDFSSAEHWTPLFERISIVNTSCNTKKKQPSSAFICQATPSIPSPNDTDNVRPASSSWRPRARVIQRVQLGWIEAADSFDKLLKNAIVNQKTCCAEFIVYYVYCKLWVFGV